MERWTALTEHASRAPVIIAARRTPIATRGGRLAAVPADELAAAALTAVHADATALLGSAPELGDVVLGNCMGPGGNTARVAALRAGVDVRVPGLTVDRQCGSGLAAIVMAAEQIRAGDDRARLAGGVESASTAPERRAAGVAYNRAAFAPDGLPDPDMGPAAQYLAERGGITRERQDAYAARSHHLARAATERYAFAEELAAVPVPNTSGGGSVRSDDAPRRAPEALLRRFPPLHAAQTPGGIPSVTAGNSCRISDGAAAVLLLPEDARGTAPGLRIRGTATVGVDPRTPGIGPVPAIERLLADAGITLDDVHAIEIVEAFAAQTLAVLDALGLAAGTTVDERVNADGGALASGHPWGASGAIAVVRLFSRLVRGGAPAGSLGIATAAIGGGMGVAVLVEVVR